MFFFSAWLILKRAMQPRSFKSQNQTPNILQQARGRISNTNKSVIHPPSKLKKTRMGSSIEEIVDKFTWEQVIIDPQLNFAPRTRGYHPWIKIKSRLDTFFNKLVGEYQTQYKSVIHPLLRLKKIKTNDLFCSPKCLRKVFISLVENKSSLTLN